MRISGRIVRPGGVVPGRVHVSGTTIVEVDASAVDSDDFVVPGFVDLHCHGGGGHSFTHGDPVAARGAADFHLAHGTTTMVASLVSSPFEVMRRATAALAPLDAITGLHFEGPYLSRARCGAQNPAHLRDPSVPELAELIGLGAGKVRMVTLAPELPGALEAIGFLAGRGVIAAIGHTDATYEQTLAGVVAGASVGTHLCNGMRPPHHREPGPVVALLDSPTVVCELVADGVHLHPGMLAFAARAAGPHRCALVTDAIDAAGMPDGEYELGGEPVLVRGGVARLGSPTPAGSGSAGRSGSAESGGSPEGKTPERGGSAASAGALAGSTATMDAALRTAVVSGVGLADAVLMAATTPARVLGLGDQVGAIEAGLRADLVVLDRDLRVKRVLRAGVEVS